ncbi:MAG: hypothetical protein HQL69_19200 [Magnetococcales bacterium]|nr:hypothetical protein [Magnetococcales bacterium]
MTRKITPGWQCSGAVGGHLCSYTSHEQATELRCRAVAGEQKTILAREFGISRQAVYAYLAT